MTVPPSPGESGQPGSQPQPDGSSPNPSAPSGSEIFPPSSSATPSNPEPASANPNPESPHSPPEPPNAYPTGSPLSPYPDAPGSPPPSYGYSSSYGGGMFPPASPPPYGTDSGQPGSTKGNIFGILALCFGVGSIVLFCLLAGFWAGIPAVVLGSIGMRKFREGQADNKHMALIGLILGIVGIVIGLAFCAVGIGNWHNWNNNN